MISLFSDLHEYLIVSHQLNRNGYQSVRGRYSLSQSSRFGLLLLLCVWGFFFSRVLHEFPNECEYEKYKSKCWCSFFISFVFHSQIFLFFHFFCLSFLLCLSHWWKKKRQRTHSTETKNNQVTLLCIFRTHKTQCNHSNKIATVFYCKTPSNQWQFRKIIGKIGPTKI